MTSSDIRLIILSAFAGLAISYRMVTGWRNRVRLGEFDDTGTEEGASLVISMYTTGVGLAKVSDGTLLGMHYSLLITSETSHPDELPVGINPAPSGQIIMSLDLPSISNVHIAGFSLKNDTFRYLLGNTNISRVMSPIKLEGDFPDYFKLYCTKGRELELLELLDPASMAYLVDFCERLNFELVGNSLYFVQSEINDISANNVPVVEQKTSRKKYCQRSKECPDRLISRPKWVSQQKKTRHNKTYTVMLTIPSLSIHRNRSSCLRHIAGIRE